MWLLKLLSKARVVVLEIKLMSVNQILTSHVSRDMTWLNIYMSHFSYSYKTKLENGFSLLISEMLNICKTINWTDAFSKAFCSLEALILVLSKNARLYDNNWNSFQSKILYIVLIFKFVHLSKNMPTEHQLLVTVLAYRK